MTTAVAAGFAGSVLQENLGKALGIAGRFVSPKGVVPITTNVLLQADSGRLRVAATDLDLWCSLLIAWKPEGDPVGAVTAPAGLLAATVETMGAVPIVLSTSGPKLSLSGGRVSSSMQTMAAEDFPRVRREFPDEPAVVFDPKELRLALSRVASGAGGADEVSVLTGLQVRASEEGVRFASADRYRLHIEDVGVPGLRDPFEVIVPGRFAREAERLLAGRNEPVELYLGGSRQYMALRLKDGEIEIGCQLIQGTFPDYRKLIPEEHLWSFVARQEEWLAAVRSAAVFARDNLGIVRMVGDGDGGLTVRGQADEIGDADAVVPVELEGDVPKVALNLRYLTDALTACGPGEVVLSGTGPSSQVLMRPRAGTFRAVVMPMFVSGWDR